MPLNTFSPNNKITANKLNQNFEGLADGSEIEAGAIKADHISDQEDWIVPTLLNSWVEYGSVYHGPAYMKDHLGFVHLRGLLKNGSSATAAMFTLPEGYRPAERLMFNQRSSTGSARVDIEADGTVLPGTGASTSYTSISGIYFKAEQ